MFKFLNVCKLLNPLSVMYLCYIGPQSALLSPLATTNWNPNKSKYTHMQTSSKKWVSLKQLLRLTGLVWTVESSSNLTVAEVMTLIWNSIWSCNRSFKSKKGDHIPQQSLIIHILQSSDKFRRLTLDLFSILNLWGLLHLHSSQSVGQGEQGANETDTHTVARWDLNRLH